MQPKLLKPRQKVEKNYYLFTYILFANIMWLKLSKPVKIRFIIILLIFRIQLVNVFIGCYVLVLTQNEICFANVDSNCTGNYRLH